MPTAKAEGSSKEVYLVDALPAGTAEIGRIQRIRDVDTAVTLSASSVKSASAAGTDVSDATLESASALLLVCDFTAHSVGTTLDVCVQAKVGSLYTNLARFSQFATTVGTKAIRITRGLAFATEITLAADPTVGTGLLVNNHDWLSTLRIKYTIVGTSYTFSVVAYPVR